MVISQFANREKYHHRVKAIPALPEDIKLSDLLKVPILIEYGLIIYIYIYIWYFYIYIYVVFLYIYIYGISL